MVRLQFENLIKSHVRIGLTFEEKTALPAPRTSLPKKENFVKYLIRPQCTKAAKKEGKMEGKNGINRRRV